ncbi:MAG: DNA mismatch repair endonuclease MutL [Gemmatimonadales bacterium]|nr:DNA mismatch repair endonuclease MutL [Gemmatimonadales bacterium]
MSSSQENSPSHIRVLDSATIDRIAAGEVIERPASIIKELVENALDAGASTLTITLQDGGLTSLSVDDNGHGIPFRDLPLAFERHATSKIASAADLMQIDSFGFRGEALASIASVSKVRCISRTNDQDTGGMIELAGSEITRREPAPRNRGTTVTISDLFYNTPARRKFMKTAQAEKRAVMKLLTQLALAHQDLRWLVKADGEVAMDLRPASSLTDRARDLFGASVLDHLARFEMEKGGFSLGGLASRPTWTRGNREQQFLFINRRPVENRALSQAIFQAYREVVPAGRHPVVIAFLQVPVGEVDVNVHPAKTEVRLLLEREIFGLLKNALQDGLSLRKADELRPWVSDTEDDSTTEPSGPNAAATERIAKAEDDYLRDYFRRGGSAGFEFKGVPKGQGELFGSEALAPSQEGDAASPGIGDSSLGTAQDAPLHSAPFWQLHRTYIVTQIRGGLVLIDQHNSHERILYNEAKQALGGGGQSGDGTSSGSRVTTQQLLFPAHLELTPGQVQAWQTHADQLEAMGFSIEPFGGQSILVQGIPSSLKNWSEGRLLLDILDDLAWDDKPSQENQVDLLASYACHAAVRAGESLTLPEMQNLVDRLFATDTPLSCPHGRPTLIQFSLAELEKRFGRS